MCGLKGWRVVHLHGGSPLAPLTAAPFRSRRTSPWKKSVLGRGPITAIFINLRRQESRRVATFKTQFGAAWRRGKGTVDVGFLVDFSGMETENFGALRHFLVLYWVFF